MANIQSKVESIRQAVFGKDVREALASGIEDINSEVVNTTARQNVIDSQEQARIDAENIRKNNENTRQQAEIDRQNKETYRETTFAAMEHADATFEIVEARGGKPVLNDRFVKIETDVSQNASQLSDIAIYPETFKSESDSDYTNAFSLAIAFLNSQGGGNLILGQGKIYNGNINILFPNICVSGSGILKGEITIGDAIIQQEMNCHISGITIEYDSLIDGNIGISLRHSSKITIDGNILFKNCDKAIYVEPLNETQHVNRLTIGISKYYNCNYCFYADKPIGSIAVFPTGDVHIIGIQAYGNLKSHIYGLGIDGIIINSNTLFFPSYASQNANKEYNIYLDYANWVNINGNNLFEAGKESILLSHCQNFTVHGNNIAWCGQCTPSNGIRVINGDPSGYEYCLGTIGLNNIMFPSLSGISIEGVSGHIQVSGNEIRGAGDTTHYYGTTDLSTLNHYGVNTELTTKFVNVIGNLSSSNLNNIQGDNNYYNGNFDMNKNAIEKRNVLTLNTDVTTFSVKGYKQVNLAQPSTNTIITISDGVSGQEITLVGFNANTTVQHNTNIKLKGALSANILNESTLTLKYTNSKWYEISRSF